ncbi:MAG: hypothetical protein U0798_15035 [Gemmataceae bacterium]
MRAPACQPGNICGPARSRHGSLVKRCPILPGSGRSFLFNRDGGPQATEGTFTFRVFRNRDWTAPIFDATPAVDVNTGAITVNLTAAQTTLLMPNVEYIGTLWRTDGDDNTDAVASLMIWVGVG